MAYIDHFAEKSNQYLVFRPDYPTILFDYLASLVKEHDLAWDCGTGNGQAAFALANYFTKVVATDINQEQLTVAPKKNNISYVCCPAEKTQILNNSVDLITVAQALHWFDFSAFYTEVQRVAKPEGVFAAWCYSLGSINSKIDSLIKKLYVEILGDTYWPAARKYIDEKYITIPFPFVKLATPQFYIKKSLDYSELLGYLQTWSAVKEYQRRVQQNPIDLILDDLKKAWGDQQKEQVMHWPIHLLVGYVKEVI